jgi:hypothetical protein
VIIALILFLAWAFLSLIFSMVLVGASGPLFFLPLWAVMTFSPVAVAFWLRLRADKIRLQSIEAHTEWPEEIREKIKQRKVGLGMTTEMVIMSWGNPTKIDNKEVSKHGSNERWVYGFPRPGRPAQYLWFENGKVSKMKT